MVYFSSTCRVSQVDYFQPISKKMHGFFFLLTTYFLFILISHSKEGENVGRENKKTNFLFFDD